MDDKLGTMCRELSWPILWYAKVLRKTTAHCHEYGDGVRLRLWTAATSGPIIYLLGGIWVWITMMDVVDWGNLPIRLPKRCLAILRAEPSSSKSGGSGHRKSWILSSIIFILIQFLLRAVKSYDMGPPALLPIWRKVRCRSLSPLKICRLGRVFTREP
jgi:hypothetical protein